MAKNICKYVDDTGKIIYECKDNYFYLNLDLSDDVKTENEIIDEKVELNLIDNIKFEHQPFIFRCECSFELTIKNPKKNQRFHALRRVQNLLTFDMNYIKIIETRQMLTTTVLNILNLMDTNLLDKKNPKEAFFIKKLTKLRGTLIEINKNNDKFIICEGSKKFKTLQKKAIRESNFLDFVKIPVCINRNKFERCERLIRESSNEIGKRLLDFYFYNEPLSSEYVTEYYDEPVSIVTAFYDFIKNNDMEYYVSYYNLINKVITKKREEFINEKYKPFVVKSVISSGMEYYPLDAYRNILVTSFGYDNLYEVIINIQLYKHYIKKYKYKEAMKGNKKFKNDTSLYLFTSKFRLPYEKPILLRKEKFYHQTFKRAIQEYDIDPIEEEEDL